MTSLVLLDRFTLAYPQVPLARAALRWRLGRAGTAEVGGFASPAIVLDVTAARARRSGSAGSRRPAASCASVRRRGALPRGLAPRGSSRPRVARAELATLRDAANQADYLLIAPERFLRGGRPLVERRRSQGLRGHGGVARGDRRAVRSRRGFGGGDPGVPSPTPTTPGRPSPRYVVLLGGSIYGPEELLRAAPSPAAAPAVDEDLLPVDGVRPDARGGERGRRGPDLAIGRLPATSVERGREDGGQAAGVGGPRPGLDGAASLVADNPDAAGTSRRSAGHPEVDFLQGRESTAIFLSEIGNRDATRPILEAFNQGVSLVSYVGHGGAAVWARRERAQLPGHGVDGGPSHASRWC